MVSAAAHWPVSGVKIKVNVPATEVLMVSGTHVPVIPLIEVSGNAGGVVFWQSGPICANTGVTCGSMVMSMVSGRAH